MKTIKITIDGVEMDVDVESTFGKKAIKAVEDKRESEMSQFVTAAYSVLRTSMGETYGRLTDEQKTALTDRSIIVSFNSRRIAEAQVTRTKLVKILSKVRGPNKPKAGEGVGIETQSEKPTEEKS
jgi:hypothetical protein|tara:strand:- start:296 stop:670 length:375 start_codon:yes stop_codon:yes gene_type:complete